MTVMCINCKHIRRTSKEIEADWRKKGAGTPYRCRYEKQAGAYVGSDHQRECREFEQREMES